MTRESPLHQLHLELGARLVDFAGWQLPLQYDGILTEHRHTRAQASLFDVSHMGQLRFERTAEALAALEQLSPSDLRGLKPMQQRYTVLLNDNGGIEDDCMVARADGFAWMVVNAARTEHDLKLLAHTLPPAARPALWSDRALLALQGPAAAEVIVDLCSRTAQLPFMQLADTELGPASCLVARSGYTGEDGFEISCRSEDAVELARLLLTDPRVRPAGLGARDSLRLEAGLCLYGQDLHPGITPIEARLGWVIGKDRRDPDSPQANFAGAARVLQQMRDGPQRLRVGLSPRGKRPVRPGAQIHHSDSDQPVGEVTSGGFAPSLNAPHAMGYVRTDLAEKGQELFSLVRGHQVPLIVCPPARFRRRS